MKIFTLKTSLALLFITQVFAVAQEKFHDKFFDSNGAKLRYIESGNGEPIILLHGNTGSADSWLRTGLFQKLSENYRVIAFDARGHGKSAKPHIVSAYGIEMSNDVIRLMDHLNIEKAHVLGSSMGARTLSKTITTHENRFQSAILVGSAPRGDRSIEEKDSLEQRHDERLSNPPKKLIDKGQDIKALATLILGFPELAVTDRELKSLTIPLLSIVGSKDDNITWVKRLKEIVPRLEMNVIEGEKHGPDIQRNPEFTRALLPFLSKNKM